MKSLTEEFDTGTAGGRLMLTMLSGFAAHEREQIRDPPNLSVSSASGI